MHTRQEFIWTLMFIIIVVSIVFIHMVSVKRPSFLSIYSSRFSKKCFILSDIRISVFSCLCELYLRRFLPCKVSIKIYFLSWACYHVKLLYETPYRLLSTDLIFVLCVRNFHLNPFVSEKNVWTSYSPEGWIFNYYKILLDTKKLYYCHKVISIFTFIDRMYFV